jgi:protein gp37
MGQNSGIQWTEHTWNPWQGCPKKSEGCANCYMYARAAHRGLRPSEVARSKTTFNAPLKMQGPARVFVCSLSDFWLEEADRWRYEAWAVMRRAPGLTYLILTKWPENMARRLPPDWGVGGWQNVWLGVTVESDRHYDRLDILAETPAAVRFVSCEPLLTPLDLTPWLGDGTLDWVITGGESPGEDGKCRRAESGWFAEIRDQCLDFDVPFCHKQNGGRRHFEGAWGGRLLDGRVWDGYPEHKVVRPPEQMQMVLL